MEQEKRNYDAGGKFINNYELRKRFTVFKNEPDNQWLYTISNNVCKQAIKDAVNAYERFFKGLAKHPKYKSRRRSKTAEEKTASVTAQNLAEIRKKQERRKNNGDMGI